MRAVLLSENPSLIARFEAVFVLAEIDLTVTTTVGEMLAAAARERDVAFLVVDCSPDTLGDLKRCSHVVRQTALPVHIVHPRPAALDELRPLAKGELL